MSAISSSQPAKRGHRGICDLLAQQQFYRNAAGWRSVLKSPATNLLLSSTLMLVSGDHSGNLATIRLVFCIALPKADRRTHHY